MSTHEEDILVDYEGDDEEDLGRISHHEETLKEPEVIPEADIVVVKEPKANVSKEELTQEKHEQNQYEVRNELNSNRDKRAASSASRSVTAENRSYGVYIPPFKRRQMEQEAKEKSLIEDDREAKQKKDAFQKNPSLQEQRQKWEDLKKVINGTINRLNIKTIKELIHNLFQNANLIRAKGILAKAVLRAAMTSPTFAPVYASLVAVINTKLPEIGELILIRSILTFRRSYARQDRGVTMSITNFLGCLFNQGLCHELLCLQLLTILLEGDPTDDSVDVAIQFTKVVGSSLMESSPAGIHAVMERFRSLLHDGRIGRRVQFKIEELMKIRKNRFQDYPSLEEDLDLVERDEQIMFEIGLDDEDLDKQEGLDAFRYSDTWNEDENDWIQIRREILGEDSEDESGSGESETDKESGEEGSDSESEDEDGVLVEAAPETSKAIKKVTEIHDLSEQDLVNLRRTIYLTIMSSASFEESAHKLSKIEIPPGKEMELINMIIECCSQERTFLRYYGLIAARFCVMDRRWANAFHEAFIAQYNTIHRLETNKLRNVAKLFAHILHTDSLSWSCLSCIHLNEDETTSSSRIFLKILVQEIAEAIGIGALVKRFETDDPETAEWYKEIFPKDNPRKTRYAINFFTSIGLGPLTDGLRDWLKNAPKMIMMQAEAEAKQKMIENAHSDDSSVLSTSSSSVSSSSSSSSFSSSSSSSSDDDSSRSGRRKRRYRSSRQKDRGSRRRRSSSSSSQYSSSRSASSSSSYSSSTSSRPESRSHSRGRDNQSRRSNENRDSKDERRRGRSDSRDRSGKRDKQRHTSKVDSRSQSRSRSYSRSLSMERKRTDTRKAQRSRSSSSHDTRSYSSTRDRNRQSHRPKHKIRNRSTSISPSSTPDRSGKKGRKMKRSRSYSSSSSRSMSSSRSRGQRSSKRSKRAD
jgi:pre-mRNA-splicing factor CWC22